ncbi:MAG: hypothetical protein ACRDWW_08055, partial [Acidimicrobiales bacterium]
LEADLQGSATSGGGAPAGSGSPGATSGGASPASGGASPGSSGGPALSGSEQAGTTAPPTGARRIDGPEAEPVDLLAVAGGSTMKRVLPAAGVVAFILLLLRRRRAKRARKARRARGLVDEVLG